VIFKRIEKRFIKDTLKNYFKSYKRRELEYKIGFLKKRIYLKELL
jgi:hypothetical protein